MDEVDGLFLLQSPVLDNPSEKFIFGNLSILIDLDSLKSMY
jgi:hypothetical protein